MPGPRDDERRTDADELHCLVEDDLDPAGVGLVAGELARLLGRFDAGELHDPALDLRDRFLRDDNHVTVLELRPLCDERREVVAFRELRQSLDRRH